MDTEYQVFEDSVTNLGYLIFIMQHFFFSGYFGYFKYFRYSNRIWVLDVFRWILIRILKKDRVLTHGHS